MRCCMKFINRFLEIYLFVIPMHVMTMSENARFIYIYIYETDYFAQIFEILFHCILLATFCANQYGTIKINDINNSKTIITFK